MRSWFSVPVLIAAALAVSASPLAAQQPVVAVDLEHVLVAGLAVAIPAAHRLSAQTTIAPGDLRDETLLLREPTSRTRQATERILETAHVTPAQIIEFHTRDAIREAIAAFGDNPAAIRLASPATPEAVFTAIRAIAPTRIPR